MTTSLFTTRDRLWVSRMSTGQERGGGSCEGCSDVAPCDRCGEPQGSLEHQRASWASSVLEARPGIGSFWKSALASDAYFQGGIAGQRPDPRSAISRHFALSHLIASVGGESASKAYQEHGAALMRMPQAGKEELVNSIEYLQPGDPNVEDKPPPVFPLRKCCCPMKISIYPGVPGFGWRAPPPGLHPDPNRPGEYFKMGITLTGFMITVIIHVEIRTTNRLAEFANCKFHWKENSNTATPIAPANVWVDQGAKSAQNPASPTVGQWHTKVGSLTEQTAPPEGSDIEVDLWDMPSVLTAGKKGVNYHTEGEISVDPTCPECKTLTAYWAVFIQTDENGNLSTDWFTATNTDGEPGNFDSTHLDANPHTGGNDYKSWSAKHHSAWKTGKTVKK